MNKILKLAADIQNCDPARDIADYLQRWDGLTDYVAQEQALHSLFSVRGAGFLSQDDMMVKCATLNDFYSTNIYKIYYVVQHYLGVQNLAQRLASGDRTLVKDLRTVPIVTGKGERKEVDYYSFATKFCSHHEPDKFPIYDKFVARMLVAFPHRDKQNSKLRQEDLKVYQTFCDEIVKFRDRYGLANYTFKELDRYLWLLGKELSGK